MDCAGRQRRGPPSARHHRYSQTSDQLLDSADAKLSLVFIGEIYNYLELREELQHESMSFRPAGDTEVLIVAYRHWGEDCLQRLNGMWAFAIWDRRREPGRERLFSPATEPVKSPSTTAGSPGALNLNPNLRDCAHG